MKKVRNCLSAFAAASSFLALATVLFVWVFQGLGCLAWPLQEWSWLFIFLAPAGA